LRIDRFDIMAYGHFTAKSLEFKAAPRDFHLIYGDNEAGKSTSLRALTAWLFGIPTRCQDNFLHESKDLRLGGKLSLQDGKAIEFIRKKSRSKSLIDYHTNSPISEHALTAFIPSHINEDIFSRLWGIKHEELVEGGEELLSDSGDIGRALFSAAMGLAGIQNLVKELEEKIEDIYLPRGKVPKLNKALELYKDIAKNIKKSSLNDDDWQQLQQGYEESQSKLREIEEKITANEKKLRCYQRVVRLQEPLLRYHRLQSDLKELDAVVSLPKNFSREFTITSTDLRNVGSNLLHDKHKREKLHLKAQSVKNLDTIRLILSHEEQIIPLREEVGAIQKAQHDLPKLESDYEDKTFKAERICHNKLHTTLDGIDAWFLLRDQKSILTDLSNEYCVLEEKKKEQQNQLVKIQSICDQLQKSLAKDEPGSFNFALMKASVLTAQKAGDIEARYGEEKRQYEKEITACDNILRRLGKYQGDLKSLPRQRFLSHESIQKYQKKFQALKQDRLHLKKELTKLEEDARRSRRELQRIESDKELPQEDDLERLQQKRSEIWEELKEPLLKKHVLTVEQARTKVHSYEKTVKAVDDFFQHSLLLAEKVNARNALQLSLFEFDHVTKEKRASLEDLNHQYALLVDSWQKSWQEVKVEVKDALPQEMIRWLAEVNALSERVEKVTQLFCNMEHLLVEAAEHKSVVVAKIRLLDADVEVDSLDLNACISLFEELLSHKQAHVRQRAELQKDITKQQQNLEEANQALKLTCAQLEELQQRWQQLTGSLVRDAHHPKIALAKLDAADEVFTLLQQRDDKKQRADACKRDLQNFAAKVDGLGQTLGISRESSVNTVEFARHLHHKWDEAKKEYQQWLHNQELLEEQEQKIEESQRRQEELLNQVAVWKEQAKVSSDEELRLAGERSQEKRKLEEDLHSTSRELDRLGGGQSLEQIEAEYKSFDVEDLAHKLESLEHDLQSLRQDRVKISVQIGHYERDLEQIGKGSEAARLLEEAAYCRATIESYIDKYISLQTASLMLQHQMQRFRHIHQNPILKRAGELFSRLTLGSFVGLSDELKGNKPILVGLKNDEKMMIDKMSTGSRDQLYLALRLAIIEDFVEQSQPVPFIVDDVLMGFDDDRTKVCLEILGELSSKTQILMFTHHQRVVDIATSVFGVDGIQYQHLGPEVGLTKLKKDDPNKGWTDFLKKKMIHRKSS